MNNTPPTSSTAPPVSTSLFVYIRDPEQVYFQGKVEAVSSVNDKGPFDVLMQHENFICIIKDKITIHMLDKKTKEITIQKGVLKAQKNAVYIFLELESFLGKTEK